MVDEVKTKIMDSKMAVMVGLSCQDKLMQVINNTRSEWPQLPNEILIEAVSCILSKVIQGGVQIQIDEIRKEMAKMKEDEFDEEDESDE